jgi:hypothetical protein
LSRYFSAWLQLSGSGTASLSVSIPVPLAVSALHFDLQDDRTKQCSDVEKVLTADMKDLSKEREIKNTNKREIKRISKIEKMIMRNTAKYEEILIQIVSSPTPSPGPIINKKMNKSSSEISAKLNSTTWQIFRRKIILRKAFSKIQKYGQVFHTKKEEKLRLLILGRIFAKMRNYHSVRIKYQYLCFSADSHFEKFRMKKTFTTFLKILRNNVQNRKIETEKASQISYSKIKMPTPTTKINNRGQKMTNFLLYQKQNDIRNTEIEKKVMSKYNEECFNSETETEILNNKMRIISAENKINNPSKRKQKRNVIIFEKYVSQHVPQISMKKEENKKHRNTPQKGENLNNNLSSRIIVDNCKYSLRKLNQFRENRSFNRSFLSCCDGYWACYYFDCFFNRIKRRIYDRLLSIEIEKEIQQKKMFRFFFILFSRTSSAKMVKRNLAKKVLNLM